MMIYFVIDQIWVSRDGALHGAVVEIADKGESGSVKITDGNGARDTFHGTAAAFQLLPESWEVTT